MLHIKLACHHFVFSFHYLYRYSSPRRPSFPSFWHAGMTTLPFMLASLMTGGSRCMLYVSVRMSVRTIRVDRLMSHVCMYCTARCFLCSSQFPRYWRSVGTGVDTENSSVLCMLHSNVATLVSAILSQGACQPAQYATLTTTQATPQILEILPPSHK